MNLKESLKSYQKAQMNVSAASTQKKSLPVQLARDLAEDLFNGIVGALTSAVKTGTFNTELEGLEIRLNAGMSIISLSMSETLSLKI